MNVFHKLDKVQQTATNKVLTALSKDGKALLQAATGTGKTNIAVKVYKELQRKDKKVRVLWLTHTNELVEQSAERFQSLVSGTDVSLFYGKGKDTDGQVVVASVQSLSKQYNLEQFSKNAFNYIFVDEAHHTPATTWEKVLNNFSKAKRFGFTATPFRPTDTSGEPALYEYFGSIISEFSLEEAQKMGVVAKIDATIVLTNSVLEPKFDSKGDYTRATRDRLWGTEDRNEIIVRAYLKYGRKTMKKMGIKYKTICYCINSHHASEMVKLFSQAGISAALLVGDAKRLKTSERDRVYGTFLNTNDIEILCVVDILNEGADINDVGCMLMCRPTKSNIVYTQQIGRGVRIVPKYKEQVVLIDFVDNTEKKYLGYNASNLPKSGISHRNVVTEYLKDKDPVMVERRVEDVMKSIREFENQFRHPDGYWTLERCKESASYYTSALEWKTSEPKAVAAACYHKGWFQLCTYHMNKKKTNGYWTPEKLEDEAARYKSKSAFQQKSGGAYLIAKRLGIFEKITAHMHDQRLRAVKNMTTSNIFKSLRQASDSINLSKNAIHTAINSGYKAGGYHWAYCDENGKVIKNKKTKKGKK